MYSCIHESWMINKERVLTSLHFYISPLNLKYFESLLSQVLYIALLRLLIIKINSKQLLRMIYNSNLMMRETNFEKTYKNLETK